MVKIRFEKTPMAPAPPFKTIEEEAEFWDTHSVLDAVVEGGEVGFHRAPKTKTLTIRFQADDVERIRAAADRVGLGPTTLARMWILERLHANRS